MILAEGARRPSALTGHETAARVLAVDPGSASTKIALYVGDAQAASATIYHPAGAGLADRLAGVTAWLATLPDGRLDAVAGRGGLLRPIDAGTYRVSDALRADLAAGVRGEHAANLGGLLARAIADPAGIPAFVVDPVSVDEFDPVARVAGVAELERVSLLHALNVRAIARLDVERQGHDFDRARLVVAHLGSGISVVAIADGRMIDATNANEEGPFSPQRTGGLPCGQLAELIWSGRLPTWEACRAFLHTTGGLRAYLGTGDLTEVEASIALGDTQAAAALDAMAYQIAKAIGAYATVLSGRLDAVLLTGGGARSAGLIERILPRIGWIAPVRVYPGEDELAALAAGARRVLAGEECARDYAAAAFLDALKETS